MRSMINSIQKKLKKANRIINPRTHKLDNHRQSFNKRRVKIFQCCTLMYGGSVFMRWYVNEKDIQP